MCIRDRPYRVSNETKDVGEHDTIPVLPVQRHQPGQRVRHHRPGPVSYTHLFPTLWHLPEGAFFAMLCASMPVSYTHLDVYKRQLLKLFIPDMDHLVGRRLRHAQFLCHFPVSYTHLIP